jgi:hypothetical protein
MTSIGGVPCKNTVRLSSFEVNARLETESVDLVVLDFDRTIYNGDLINDVVCLHYKTEAFRSVHWRLGLIVFYILFILIPRTARDLYIKELLFKNLQINLSSIAKKWIIITACSPIENDLRRYLKCEVYSIKLLKYLFGVFNKSSLMQRVNVPGKTLYVGDKITDRFEDEKFIWVR